MGMSIEEAIRRIDEHNYIHQRKEPRAIYISEAFDVSKDTMRKYQKIEEIIRKYDVAWEFHHMKHTIDKIREVIEDGKND